LEQSLLKNCLSNEFFESNRTKLRPELFSETLAEIYSCIVKMHDIFKKDITSADLFSYWKSNHPTWTEAQSEQVQEEINHITFADNIDGDISASVINSLWQQEIGNDVAKLGIKMNEGDTSAMDKLTQLLERVAKGYLPDDIFGDAVTDDIYELLATTSDENRFKFNIETLSREVYGIGRGEFMVVAAYSNVGKTAFAVSLCAGLGGFCQQGAKVGYVANEEFGRRVKLRAIQCYTGMTEDEVRFKPSDAIAKFSGIKDRMIFRDAQGWDIHVLDAYIAKEKFDVVVCDMADKVELTDKFNSGHERLRALYYRLRELSKKHNCAIIAMSQASAEAEGRTILSMSMLEGSKVGKQSESDLLVGLGKRVDPENPDDPTRWITIMKNKISGRHTTIQCNLEVGLNRYVV
jgi:replicative DNA helicase